MKRVWMKVLSFVLLTLVSTAAFAWEFTVGGVQAKDPDAWGLGFSIGYDLFNEPIYDFGTGGRLKFMMGPTLGFTGYSYERPIFSDTGIPYNTDDQIMSEGENGLELTATDEVTDDGETIYKASGYDKSAQANYATWSGLFPAMWTFKLAWITELDGGNTVGLFVRPGIGYAMMVMNTDLPDSYNKSSVSVGPDAGDTETNDTKFKSWEYLSGFAWQIGGGVSFRNFFLEYQYRTIDIQNFDGDEYDMSGHAILFGVNTSLSYWKNDKTSAR